MCFGLFNRAEAQDVEIARRVEITLLLGALIAPSLPKRLGIMTHAQELFDGRPVAVGNAR